MKSPLKKELYFREVSSSFKAASDYNEDKSVCRAVLWGVKWFGRFTNETDTIGRYTMAEALMFMIGTLTPRQLVGTFPIEKTYDGKRWGSKDYFYTIDSIQSHGWDNHITNHEEGSFGFLWDYQNWDISHFVVEYMSTLSDMRRMQGHPGIMEEWASNNGIPLYTMHTTQDGKKYISDGNGRTKPIKAPRPKHLKIVKKRS